MHPTKLLYSFNGRLDRKGYWIGLTAVWMGAPIIFALIGLVFVGVVLSGGDEEFTKGHAIIGFIGAILLYIVLFGLAGIATLALVAKRLHDIGQSGFWCLLLTLMPSPLALISFHGAMQIVGDNNSPLYSPAYMSMFTAFLLLIALIVLGCLRGQGGANRWGLPPDGGSSIPPERIAMATDSPQTGSFGRKPAH